MKKLEGIVAPMATPLTRDDRIDTNATRALVNFLIDGGIDCLFPLGTSGEFALFDREERKTMVKTVVDETNGRVPVLAGVSDPSLENVLAFAKDAEDIGADAIVATSPYYFTTSEDGLFGHFETISRKGELPLIVYNIPEWTHLFVPPSVVQRLAEKELIVGMKYTEYNLLNLLRFLKTAGKRIAILTGSDAMTLTNLEFGGSGAVIGVANVVPRLASTVFDEFKRGNLDAAQEAQWQLLPIIEAIGIGRFPAGLKAAMSIVGMPVGDVKRPLQGLIEAERNTVAGLLRESGLFKGI